ncbi:MAG: hypothetical protein WDZ49_00765 [Litorilinea sp.]
MNIRILQILRRVTRSVTRGGLALVLAILVAGCGQLDFAAGPLLYDVAVAPDFITPNADGREDVTEIRYSLRRSAAVSIYFENSEGERYYFRQNQRRSPGDYSVFWGGVVDQPITRETAYGTQEILSHVLPDGDYRWTIEARAVASDAPPTGDDAAANLPIVEHAGQEDATATPETQLGPPELAQGKIALQEADTDVPELRNFVVVPQVFRPNQDGLRDDWVSISYYLSKEVDQMAVYLIDPAAPAIRFPIAQIPGLVLPTDEGHHQYRYEAGVNLNAEPPPDGLYYIIAEARDAAGNAVRVTSDLTIAEGGKPRADIAQGEIEWQGADGRTVSLLLGEKLCFRAVVTNHGTVPIRTSGPWPGQEYGISENYNTLARANDIRPWGPQSGVWRFGINYDTTGTDFPFRWAIGRQEDLERRVIDGDEQWYLLPGTSGQVEGCILIDEEPMLASEFWWGGLIHQDVSVPNNYVDRVTVQVGVP